MSANDQTVEQFTRSINGFEEIAIKKEFGSPLSVLQDDAVHCMRALIFIDHRRGGLKAGDAYDAAMTLTMGDVLAYFAEDPDTEGDDLGEA